jgi:putative hydrolase of the HAD superfamily
VKPRLVILDLDDTLYDYQSAHSFALNEVFNAINTISKVDKKRILKIYNQSNLNLKKNLKNTAASHNRFLYFLAICKSLSINLDVALRLNKLYWDIFLKRIHVYEGCYKFLRELRKFNIKIALLTDFQSKETFEKLRKLKLTNKFDFIITSEEIGSEKPHKKCFLAACKTANVNKKFAIVIGDNYKKDILGAINLGIFAIYICGNVKNCRSKLFPGYLQISSISNLDINSINIYPK